MAFLHAGNRIDITTKGDSKFTGTNYVAPSKNPHQLILDYFSPLFVLQRSTRSLWVYDKDFCVWRTDVSGNSTVGQLIDELNEKHVQYLKAYKDIIVQKQISRLDNAGLTQEEAEDAAIKIYKQARDFMNKNTPLISIAPSARGKVMEDLRNYTVHNEIDEMNKFPHLIPMKNKKYVNVFTGETGDMEPGHFFTSCVNAEICSKGEETEAISNWFDEISTGDIEKCRYLKMIAGYCFTFLVHDRHFYAILGPTGQNGKGTYKEFILKVNNGPEGMDARSKQLLQSFWASRGNANQAPENATPESYELMNKSFYYTDDLMPIPLDANKVKRISASEAQSGRTLYGKPVEIRPKGKIMWTLNFPPNGPGEDNAYWERAIILAMHAKYIDEGPVDPARFRFRKNHARYLELLEMTDAFFTLTVEQLTGYYQSLPWNTMRNEPVLLGTFPVPASVKATLLQERANKLPLAAFVRDYTADCKDHSQSVSVEILFKNYITYLENVNEGKLRRETTQTSFIQLMSTALDIQASHGIFENRKLVRSVVPVRKDEHAAYGQVSAFTQAYNEGSHLDAALPPTARQNDASMY